jgi:hypothetical protein
MKNSLAEGIAALCLVACPGHLVLYHDKLCHSKSNIKVNMLRVLKIPIIALFFM